MTETAFAAPVDSLGFWEERLAARGVQVRRADPRFGEQVLAFADPDGLRVEIVGTAAGAGRPWAGGPVAVEHAIRGFHGVTLSEEGHEATAELLGGVMGFKADGAEANRYRFRSGGEEGADGAGGTGAGASVVDLLCVPGGRGGAGRGRARSTTWRSARRATRCRAIGGGS